MTDKKPVIFSRPKDESLEAYKAWIKGFAQAMGAKESNMTEEEWKEKWKKFWGKWSGEQNDQQDSSR